MTEQTGKLSGKVAVVTGASKGIGAGIATVFARHGAKVVLAARGPAVLDAAQSLRDDGYDALGVQCDVSDYHSCQELAATALEAYGKIDILDCNAGICVLGDFLTSDDTWRDSHIDINIKGAWNACKAMIPAIIDAGGGSVVITSSVTGDMVADPGEAAYATTKAALVGLTKALAREFADRNVRVNCICPGYIRTPLVEGMARQSDPDDPERAINAIASAVPLGRLGTPEECGELCAFLASDEASYLTGTQMVIDGGSTLPETTSMGQ
ncbi:SDR family oxidoreductase UcpA [uncultured Bifidobacterium sp.]|uniref:SDR family oxidoreductase UcpA n=1 Tax=uncultured Bifidobacterium sp. TaxID=165187 RepID=UPI002590CAE8|nr:SDR family oxidoreductase UcpA [uncultured Bifidobacterium sp.]